jgi:branched-chain amino acid transport system substrate-binding protein
MTNRDGLRRATALMAVAALLATACTDDSGDAAEDGGTGASADSAALLGPEQPASGEPITIGYVYDGTTDVIDNAAELEAAEAAVEYVNTHLGGVAGRPIELDVCSTDQSPSGATDCVTHMVTAEVPVVLNGVTGQAGPLFAPLAEAGIPVFVPSAGDPSVLSAERVHIMGNGIVSLVAGPAKLAADAGYERAAIVTIDVPAASAALEAGAPMFYENVGVELDIVTVPPDTPDMTPNIAAELSEGPGQFEIVGDPSFCAKALDALAASGFDGTIALIPQCLDEGVRQSATNLEGAVLTTFTTTDPDSEEFQLYSAVMDTYAGAGAERGGVAPGGYQAVVGFARALAGLEGDITAETVQAALTSMPPTPMPLADGITYQCDGTKVAIATSLCSTDVLWTELDAEGNGTEYTVLKGEELLALG